MRMIKILAVPGFLTLFVAAGSAQIARVSVPVSPLTAVSGVVAQAPRLQASPSFLGESLSAAPILPLATPALPARNASPTPTSAETTEIVSALNQVKRAAPTVSAGNSASTEEIGEVYDGRFIRAVAALDKESEPRPEGLPKQWVRRHTTRSQAGKTVALQRRAQVKGFPQAARNARILARHNDHYTHGVPIGRVTDQKESGRCWIFAGLNMVRSLLIARGKVDKQFEFSENYLYFFNQLEKANRYLERVAAGANEKEEKASLSSQLQSVAPDIEDSGNFESFQFLVEKYGLVPKNAMPETASSGSTGGLNAELNYSLGITAREMLADAPGAKGRGRRHARETRQRGMSRVWKILAAHLGTPPSRFEHLTDDRQRSYTPLHFAKKFVAVNLDDYIQVGSWPRVKQGIVYAEGDSDIAARSNFRYIDVGVDRMEELALKALSRNQPVYIFASQNRDFDSKTGIMHPGIYDRSSVYGFTAKEKREHLTRASRHDLGMNDPSHLMVLTGYDRPDPNKPVVKFRVENSGGAGVGDSGVFHMYREWFRQNAFSIIVHKSLLSRLERTAWKQEAEDIP